MLVTHSGPTALSKTSASGWLHDFNQRRGVTPLVTFSNLCEATNHRTLASTDS